MEGIKHSLEQLRDLALGEPSVFSGCFKRLLAADFDATFYYVKTQKLLLRRRSSKWISNLELELVPWLEQASLKGKQRTQIARYLVICKSLQQLFEIVDKQSSTLRIWEASTEDLLRSLFASVEELRFKQTADTKNQEPQFNEQLNALKHIELTRMEHRTHCDYVTRVVAQIAHLGVKPVGTIKLTPSDIRDALTLAALDDMLLHILDCHTYRNFRISVEGKHLKMHGTKSLTEASYTWSSLRAQSRELVDSHQLVEQLKKAEIVAKQLQGESNCFSNFLETTQGIQLLQALQTSRAEYARILKRDVSEQIDLNLTVKTHYGTFQVEELLDCWSLLFQLATCAQMWCSVFQKSNIAVLPKAQLISLITRSIGCRLEQGKRLVSQFTLDPSRRNQDPFFRPLVQINNEHRLIAGSFIETSRFSRNLFTIAIREGSMNFSAKGLKPLKDLYQEFMNAGFKTVINFPITVSGNTVTDVDIAATKDGFLFVGQIKVLIHPDTIYDDWKVLENLKRAAAQLKTTVQHVPLLQDRLQLMDGGFLVVPFILTNVWGLTGTVVQKFKVIDFSYLSGLLRGGEIWKVQFKPEPTREIFKLIKGKYPTGEELSRLVLKPIHEAMFEKPRLEERSFDIGDWTVTIPVDTAKIPNEEDIDNLSPRSIRRNKPSSPSFSLMRLSHL